MPSCMLVLLGCILLLPFLYLAATSIAAHSFSIAFVDSPFLVAYAAFYKVQLLFVWVHHGVFNFFDLVSSRLQVLVTWAQYNLLNFFISVSSTLQVLVTWVHHSFFAFLRHNNMPPWLLCILITIYFSPHLRQAFVAIFTAAADAGARSVDAYYAYHRDATIAQLRIDLSESHPNNYVQKLRRIHSKQVARFEQQVQRLKSEILRSNSELMDSRATNATRQHKIEDLAHHLEMTQDLYQVGAVLGNEKELKRLLRKAQDDIIDLQAQLAEAGEQHERAQRCIASEQWDYDERQKLVREYEAKLAEKQQTVDQQEAAIVLLKHNPERDVRHQRLQRHDALLTAIKTTIFAMITSGDEMMVATGTLFVSALKLSNMDLAELGIDPYKHQTYLTWVRDMHETGFSALRPSSGLHLDGVRGSLSGVYLSSN